MYKDIKKTYRRNDHPNILVGAPAYCASSKLCEFILVQVEDKLAALWGAENNIADHDLEG